jgi:hypothetical protein
MEVEDHRDRASKGVKMSISTSRLSYQDCFTLMEQALEDTKGVRVCMETFDKATFFRMRCHTARQIDRKDNKVIYKEGEKLHGASLYDALTFRIREDEEGKFWVYAEKTELEPGAIESLSDLEEFDGQGQ